MFCKKCGSQIQGNERYCPKCGAFLLDNQRVNENIYNNQHNVTDSYDDSAEESQSVTNSKIYNILMMTVSIVIAVIWSMYIISTFYAYETPIKTLFEGVEKRDGEILISVFPDQIVEQAKEESGLSDDAFQSTVEIAVLGLVSDWDEDFEVDYKIGNVDDLSYSEISGLEDEIEVRYDCYLNISAAKEVETTAFLGENIENTETLTVIEVGNKWYLSPMDLDKL